MLVNAFLSCLLGVSMGLLLFDPHGRLSTTESLLLLLLLYGSESGGWMQSSSAGKGKGRINKRMRKKRTMNVEWGGTADYDRNGRATTASSSRTVFRISAQDCCSVLVNVSVWPLFFFVGFANRIFMEQLL